MNSAMLLATENATVTVKRREKISIIADILEVARHGAPKTRLMYQANLCYKQIGVYIHIMEKTDLMTKVNDGDKTVYKATKKGLVFLDRYCEIVNMLNGTQH